METKVSMFKDKGISCWSTIELKDGNFICISVGATSIIIKKGKSLLFGRKIHKTKGKLQIGVISETLTSMYPDSLIPHEMNNPALRSLTNAIMHCKNIDEVFELLEDITVKQENIQGRKSAINKAVKIYEWASKGKGKKEPDSVVEGMIREQIDKFIEAGGTEKAFWFTFSNEVYFQTGLRVLVK